MGQILVPMLISSAIGVATGVANSVLNNRPYHPSITVGIYDTPDTRRASGNAQKDNVRLLIENKKQDIVNIRQIATPSQPTKQEIVKKQIQQHEQEKKEKKADCFKNFASGLGEKLTKAQISKLPPKMEKTQNNDRSFQMEKVLNNMEAEQKSKLLCPEKLRNIAMEIVSEFTVELVGHGGGVSVPHFDSEEFKKFRSMIRIKKSKS